MLAAARDAVDATAAELARQPPLLIAVTVLTSLDDADLAATGIARRRDAQALRLARLAADCGLDGVVCSAQEAPALRAALRRRASSSSRRASGPPAARRTTRRGS